MDADLERRDCREQTPQRHGARVQGRATLKGLLFLSLALGGGCADPDAENSDQSMQADDDEGVEKAAGTRRTYQAESRSFQSQCGETTGWPGYTGAGFIECDPGGILEWNNVNAPSAGVYKLIFRYANGSGVTSQNSVSVNDGDGARVTFASTGGWANWRNQSVTVQLRAGLNKVRITTDPNGDVLNLDKMVLVTTDGGGTTGGSTGSTTGGSTGSTTGGGTGGGTSLPVFLMAGQSNMVGNVDSNLFGSLLNELTQGSGSGQQGRLEGALRNWYLNYDGGYASYGYTAAMVTFEASELIRLRNEGIADADLRSGHPSVMCAMNDAKVAPLTTNCGNIFGPELAFGHVLNTKSALIKVAQGGTQLNTDWRPPRSGGNVGPLYQQLRARIGTLKSNPASIHPECATRACTWAGFVWFQGENDTMDSGAANAYAQNLRNLIADVRSETGSSSLPVVIVEMGKWAQSMDYGSTVLAAQRQVVGADSRARLVKTDDLSGYYHYDPAAQLIIGERVGKAMRSLR